jgi:hypothetical protein
MADPQQPIAIMAVVDIVGALATGSMKGNLYLLDTNRANGSTGLGTEELKTEVKKDDQLHWTVLPLECEAYVSIDDILIDKELCEPQQKTYPGTDITYWIGTIKKDVDVAPYHIKFKVGTRVDPMITASTPFLVGAGK